MRFRRHRKDPISDEAKRARERADSQSCAADVVREEAVQQLQKAESVTAWLKKIRQDNHFAEAFTILIGGNR